MKRQITVAEKSHVKRTVGSEVQVTPAFTVRSIYPALPTATARSVSTHAMDTRLRAEKPAGYANKQVEYALRSDQTRQGMASLPLTDCITLHVSPVSIDRMIVPTTDRMVQHTRSAHAARSP